MGPGQRTLHSDLWPSYSLLAGWCAIAFILGRQRRLASLYLVASIVAACFYPSTALRVSLILGAMFVVWLGIAISCKARSINESLVQVTFALVWIIFVPMLFAMNMAFDCFYFVVVVVAWQWLPLWGHTLSVATIALFSSFATQFACFLSMPSGWGRASEPFSDGGYSSCLPNIKTLSSKV